MDIGGWHWFRLRLLDNVPHRISEGCFVCYHWQGRGRKQTLRINGQLIFESVAWIVFITGNDIQSLSTWTCWSLFVIFVFEPSGTAWHFILKEYTWICSPTFDSTISHTTGNTLSTLFTTSLAVTPFTTPRRDVSRANGFHCFRAPSSLHVSFISHVLPVLPLPSLYSPNSYCTPVKCLLAKVHKKTCGHPKKLN